jgi:hypothetical protein
MLSNGVSTATIALRARMERFYYAYGTSSLQFTTNDLQMTQLLVADQPAHGVSAISAI